MCPANITVLKLTREPLLVSLGRKEVLSLLGYSRALSATLARSHHLWRSGYSRTPSATLARSALGDESWWSFKTLAPLLFVVWPLTLTHKLLKTLIDFFWTLVPALSWP